MSASEGSTWQSCWILTIDPCGNPHRSTNGYVAVSLSKAKMGRILWPKSCWTESTPLPWPSSRIIAGTELPPKYMVSPVRSVFVWRPLNSLRLPSGASGCRLLWELFEEVLRLGDTMLLISFLNSTMDCSSVSSFDERPSHSSLDGTQTRGWGEAVAVGRSGTEPRLTRFEEGS